MAGRATLTTVPSRKTTPEPSTEATITHRPSGVPNRIGRSPVTTPSSQVPVWGGATTADRARGAGAGGAGAVGPAAGGRHRRLGRALERGAAPEGSRARRRRGERRMGGRAVELVARCAARRTGAAPPRRDGAGRGAVGGGGRRAPRRWIGGGGVVPAPAPGPGADGRHLRK